jgi:hypothetical protein
MKTLKLILQELYFTTRLQAQVSVNVNLGNPSWGPVGYSSVDYYYQISKHIMILELHSLFILVEERCSFQKPS